jgi:hypothetical protein
MALEFWAVRFDSGERREIAHNTVSPGQACVLLANYAMGEVTFIGIGCDIDDVGRVETFPAEGPLAADPSFVTEDDMPSHISRVYVDADRPHVQEYVTDEDEQVDLEVRWVPSNEITPNLQVPLALMFPDQKPPGKIVLRPRGRNDYPKAA